MKRFLLLLSIFIFIVLFAFPYIIKRLDYQLNGKEILYSIRKSKDRNKKVKKVIIGDSVAKQLYSNLEFNDSIYSLTANQAISFVGYYILLKNFLENNHTEEVILLINPFTLANNLDQVFTYQYFLKPFYKEEYYNDFSVNVWKQIKKQNLYYISQFPYILNTNVVPKYEEESNKTYSISPINKEYIKKTIVLLKFHNVKYKFIMSPVNEIFKKDIDNLNRVDFFNSGFSEEEVNKYFNNVIYLPDSCFGMADKVHLKNPKNYRFLIKL